jgi:peptide/nickel transport system permease protein/oligopeptide transport system permease protein
LRTYIFYKLASVIPVLLGVSLLVFLGVRLVPGDPVDVAFRGKPPPTPEQEAAVRHYLGLDRPIHEQYVIFLSNALRGDLGFSYVGRRSVTTQIMEALPNTAKLASASLLVAMLIGLTAGVLSATFRNSWIDRISMLVAIAGVSIPAFWLGLLFIMLFSLRLGWFPVAGAETWKHLVMPAVTLGLVISASVARVTRASMLEALAQDYVRTARAKGLREAVVVLRHALRNAAIPVITILGLWIGSLLSGAFVIEATFAYPGLGRLAINAVMQRDFPMIQGITLFLAVIYILCNLLVDILYGVVDPRIKYR